MLKGITQAARELGVSPEHIRRMVRVGKWPVYRLGPRTHRIDIEEIKRLGQVPSVDKGKQKSGNEQG